MARRELLQLAQVLDLSKDKIAGAHWSYKLDGLRCFYDGGMTEGWKVWDVPWANIERDHLNRADRISTGLWTRLGKPIIAHPDWLATLPKGLCLDGELYKGKGALEESMAVKCLVPDPKYWADITFQVFDTPSASFLHDGEVVYDAKTRKEVCFAQFDASNMPASMSDFERRMGWLQDRIETVQWGPQMVLVNHHKLNLDEAVAREELNEAFDDYVKSSGGEGLMVRLARIDYWRPQRVPTLLKFKPKVEDVCQVVGYYAGEIGKTALLLGKMGSLEVKWKGMIFKLSGFTHAERELTGRIDGQPAELWAYANPGKRLPTGYSNKLFPINSTIEFEYTSLTKAGVPREASYNRKGE